MIVVKHMRHDKTPTRITHAKPLTFSQTFTGPLVTTGLALVELADGCASNAELLTMLR